ncbi:MAG: HNH endonuclease [Bacteroidales bacterium]|nr:HNH endonuclease [Candidatus Colicola caccequi]
MWILPKPLLDEALADIANVIAADTEAKVLGPTDSITLNKLYRTYDHNSGTITEVEDKTFSLTKRTALYNLYDKTQLGQSLSYIRAELMSVVDICPMCGIMPSSQLDHLMPRKDYKSLSVCRLNLVPTCGVCNNKKRKGDPSGFVHAYYDHKLENIPFFEIEIHSNPINHRMSWKFSINRAIIADNALADKVEHQISVIKLFRRLYKETNTLLADILSSNITSQHQLDTILAYEYGKYERYGMNDWRRVFLKSLIDSPCFSIAEAKEYALKIRPINGGVNA